MTAYAASVVIGQVDFNNITPYSPARGDVLFNPIGVGFHSVSGFVGGVPFVGLLYVMDAGNNRVLVYLWESLAAWQAGTPTPLLVLGQSNSVVQTGANSDSNAAGYPASIPPASARTLSTTTPLSLSPGESSSGTAIALKTSNGQVWLVDFHNHRLLRYNLSSDVAAVVLGQADFTGTLQNRGLAAPTAGSLFFSWDADQNGNTFAAGVCVDQTSGAVWVADSGNHRVLRFSSPNTGVSADIVLGQTDFVSRLSGTGLSSLQGPMGVALSADRKQLFVCDPTNARVLKYTSATAGFVVGDSGAAGVAFGAPTWIKPTTVDYDPTWPNKVWVTDTAAGYAYLLDEVTGVEVANTRLGSGDGNLFGSNEGVGGSLAFDAAGNIFATMQRGSNQNQVLYFPKSGEGTLPRLPTALFNTATNPGITGAGLRGLFSCVTAGDQMIVADIGRIMFWNGLETLTNGKIADGYLKGFSANQTSFNQFDPVITDASVMCADGNAQYLWVSLQTGIFAFHLPVRIGDTPFLSITGPISVLGGGTISPYVNWGIAVNQDSTELWLTQVNSNRALRIRNPLLSSRMVDVVLGQSDISSVASNRGGAVANNTLSTPGGIALDAHGNLWISDDSLEIQGNFRLLTFLKATIPSNNSTIILGPDADRIQTNVVTWQPAFGPNGEMVIGYNRYGPAPAPAGASATPGAFPGIYLTPLVSVATPDAYLSELTSSVLSAQFSAQGDLFIADHNRNFVRIYRQPFNPAMHATQLGVTTTSPISVGFGAELYVTVTDIVNAATTPTGVVTVGGSDVLGGPSLFPLLTGQLDKDGKVYFYADWAPQVYAGLPLDTFSAANTWYFIVDYLGDATHLPETSWIPVTVRPH